MTTPVVGASMLALVLYAYPFGVDFMSLARTVKWAACSFVSFFCGSRRVAWGPKLSCVFSVALLSLLLPSKY